MKLRLMLAAALLVVIVVAGCQRKRFEVAMQLTDQGVRRTVSVWTEDDVDSNGHSRSKILALDDSTSSGLVAVYGAPEELQDGRLRYTAEFTGDLPRDLVAGDFHNFARALVVRSPLGTTVSYVERLPGRTDMVAVAKVAEEKCDLLIAAWVAYAGQQPEFAAAPDKLARLREFLQKTLRTDMLNLGLTTWLAIEAAEAREHADTSSNGLNSMHWLAARDTAFLLERGYMRTSDMLPGLTDEMTLARGVARRVADELGYSVDAPLPPMLAALADGSRTIDNITSIGLLALGKTEDDLTTNADIIAGDLTGNAPTGSFTWNQVPVQPVTNGQWDAQAQTIVWSSQYRDGAYLPDVLFAEFTQVNLTFLVDHFGKALNTETVGKFNTWYATLPAPQQTIVDAFCGNLKPGPTLRTDILCFNLTAPDGRAAAPGDPEKLPAGMSALLPPE